MTLVQMLLFLSHFVALTLGYILGRYILWNYTVDNDGKLYIYPTAHRHHEIAEKKTEFHFCDWLGLHGHWHR